MSTRQESIHKVVVFSDDYLETNKVHYHQFSMLALYILVPLTDQINILVYALKLR